MPFFKSPSVSSFYRASKDLIAAPHAGVLMLCPCLVISPTLPSLSIATCGAKSTTMFPSSGTCVVKAFQPAFPTKGIPARPLSGKISPHLLKNKSVKSSSGSAWLISSGHELSANRELNLVKPYLNNWAAISCSALQPFKAP